MVSKTNRLKNQASSFLVKTKSTQPRGYRFPTGCVKLCVKLWIKLLNCNTLQILNKDLKKHISPIKI
jgi:hypothetical protein